MHRITEQQETELRNSLEEFKEKYPILRIEPRILDISSCFLGKNKKVNVPNYWYDGKAEPVVRAYVVRNGPQIKKFNPKKSTVNDNERKVYERLPYRESADFKVLSMLCARAMRNTAMSEFLDFGWESWNPAGISTLDKRILKIEHATRMLCNGDFNPIYDNAFIFCRESAAEAENAARLNALWTDMIGKYGEQFLDYCPFPYEVELARKVFPEEFFNEPSEDVIKKESYQHRTKAHTEESEWFMAKVAERYNERRRRAFFEDLEATKNLCVDEKKRILEIVDSAGEDGIDFVGLFYQDGEFKYNPKENQALAQLFLEGGFGCVIQDPPRDYLDKQNREILTKFYPHYPEKPYFKFYSNSVVGRMVEEGRAVEALGFGVEQLPHYVLVEQALEA